MSMAKLFGLRIFSNEYQWFNDVGCPTLPLGLLKNNGDNYQSHGDILY